MRQSVVLLSRNVLPDSGEGVAMARLATTGKVARYVRIRPGAEGTLESCEEAYSFFKELVVPYGEKGFHISLPASENEVAERSPRPVETKVKEAPLPKATVPTPSPKPPKSADPPDTPDMKEGMVSPPGYYLRRAGRYYRLFDTETHEQMHDRALDEAKMRKLLGEINGRMG